MVRRTPRLPLSIKLFLATCVILLLNVASIAFAANAQVWGQRFRTGGYWGIDVYLNTPNPTISSGQWTGGPTGVTNLTSIFIESGPTKACDVDCKLHPYGSWGNATGGGGEFVDTTALLGAGLTYRYQTNYIGGTGNKWQSIWCSGGGCRGMITGSLNVDTLPYVASGGESSGSTVHWGSITSSNATYKPYNSATLFSWCYTSTTNNVGGTISACNTSNFSWTSTY